LLKSNFYSTKNTNFALQNNKFMKKILLAALFVGSFGFAAQSSAKSVKPTKAQRAQQELMQKACERGLSSINRASSEAIIGFLASDALEGREAGYNTSIIAGEYMVSQLIEAGLEPLDGSYRHRFSAYQAASTRRPGNRWEVNADSIAKLQQGPHRRMDMMNVFGVIPGEIQDEYVIVGAHRDHWGLDPWKVGDQIYNGADDNASGVSCALQIARAFKASGMKPRRTVIFAFWDGEEKGTLGSTYFTQTWPQIKQVKGYLNFDMEGGNTQPDNPPYFAYIYSQENPAFGEWIKNDVEKYNLGLDPSVRPTENLLGGSDQGNFVKLGIPFIWYHTDWTPYYHQVTDEPEHINWDKLVDITKASYLNAWNLANEENY